MGKSLVLRSNVVKDHMIDVYWGVLRTPAYMSKLSPTDLSYSLKLTANVIVDASREGSFLRFCAHSCNGSCRSETWIVNGCFVCKLVAVCDLHNECTLDWNYQYQFHKGEELDRCYCMSDQCKLVLQQPPREREDREDYNLNHGHS